MRLLYLRLTYFIRFAVVIFKNGNDHSLAQTRYFGKVGFACLGDWNHTKDMSVAKGKV